MQTWKGERHLLMFTANNIWQNNDFNQCLLYASRDGAGGNRLKYSSQVALWREINRRTNSMGSQAKIRVK
jgi:hypothetical protein